MFLRFFDYYSTIETFYFYKIYNTNKSSSSDDEFIVATPDETAGKETEFSLVGSFRNKFKKIYDVRKISLQFPIL